MRLTVPLVVLLAGSVVHASDAWLNQPFETWTASQVRSVLQESPWVGALSIAYAPSGGGFQSSVNREVELLEGRIAWTSAPPVRQAEWRSQNASATRLTDVERAALVARSANHVLTIALTSYSAAGRRPFGPSYRQAFTSPVLKQGKLIIQGTTGRAGFLKTDGTVDWQPDPSSAPPCVENQKAVQDPAWWKQFNYFRTPPTGEPGDLALPDLTPPIQGTKPPFPDVDRPKQPACAQTLLIEFVFPRSTSFSATGGSITFTTDAAPRKVMKRTFKPKEMVIGGNLAL